jgi:hypothetical protein
MRKEDVIYYGLLFLAGVGVAVWMKKEYNSVKYSSDGLNQKRNYVTFGVRG